MSILVVSLIVILLFITGGFRVETIRNYRKYKKLRNGIFNICFVFGPCVITAVYFLLNKLHFINNDTYVLHYYSLNLNSIIWKNQTTLKMHLTGFQILYYFYSMHFKLTLRTNM